MGKIICKLSGDDGNAYAVMGRVNRALRKAGVSKEVIDTYREDATSGDYTNLLRVSVRILEDYQIKWT